MGRPIENLPEYVHPTRYKDKLYTAYRRGNTHQKIYGSAWVTRLNRFKADSEWWANYARIHAGFEDEAANAAEEQRKKPVAYGSLAWLIDRYLGDNGNKPNPIFEKLSKTSQSDYRKHLRPLRELYGGRMWASLKTSWVVKLRDKHQKTPRTADYYTTLLRILGKLAIQLDIRKDNPAENVELIYKPKRGYPPWNAYEMAWFEASDVKPQIKLSYYLALYTGQREEDVIRMRWNDIKDGWIHVIQEKTGEKVPVPIHDDLHPIILEAKKDRKGVFIVTKENGQPYSKEGWRTVWGRERAKTGLNHVKFHGLRKNASIALVEAGCDEQLARSITGHRTVQALQIYTAEVRQRIMARQAMDKWNAASRERVEL